MNDLINRQEAINIANKLIIHMEEYHQYNQGVSNYCAELSQLPSAQQWIPCSERMPEPYITVLVTYKSGVVSFAWYNGSYWTRGAMSRQKMLKTVKAWMPLPEAWKGEKENEPGESSD